jgi:hypothetical protein
MCSQKQVWNLPDRSASQFFQESHEFGFEQVQGSTERDMGYYDKSFGG